MRKSTILLFAAVFTLSLLVGIAFCARRADDGFVTHELSGRIQYHPSMSAQAQLSARKFLVQLMPGNGFLELGDMRGLSAIVSNGMAADRREFLGFLRETLSRDWVGVTVEVESYALPTDHPDSHMGVRYATVLVISGLTEIPVLIPFN